MYHGNSDLSLTILKKAITICVEISDEKMLGRLHRNLGLAEYIKWSSGVGDYRYLPSLDNHKKAAVIAKKHNDIYGYKLAQGNIISSFFQASDSETSNDSAHYYADQMLEFAIERNNSELEAWAYSDLAGFYQWSGEHRDYQKSSYYQKKAYELSSELSNYFQIKCLLNLSELADYEYAYYEKIDYLEKSIRLSSKITNRPNTHLVNSIYYLADAYGYPVSNFDKVDKLLDEALSYKNMFNEFSYNEYRISTIRGRNFLYQGEFDKAVEIFTEVTNLEMIYSDYLLFFQNINLGEAYYHLGNFSEAKIYINKAIEIMTWSNAVKDDLSVALYYILNEINLGNLKSASDVIPNPLKTVGIDEHWSSKNAVSINDWVSYYMIEDNEDLLERTREVYGEFIFMNYNLYKIYHLLGDEEKAEKFINLSHDGIIDVGYKLKRRDKQRFLNDNILISNIISDWNRITH